MVPRPSPVPTSMAHSGESRGAVASAAASASPMKAASCNPPSLGDSSPSAYSQLAGVRSNASFSSSNSAAAAVVGSGSAGVLHRSEEPHRSEKLGKRALN